MENKLKKSDRTRARIEIQFLEMLKERYICDIKVKHITDALGIDRTTFYYYFSSIYDLAETIEERFFLPDMNYDPEQMAIYNARLAIENKEAMRSLLNSTQHEPLFKAKLDQRQRERIPYLFKSQGIEVSDSEIDMYAAFLASGYNGLILYFLRDDCDYTEREISELMGQLIPQNMLLLYQLAHQVRANNTEKNKGEGTPPPLS